MTNTLSAAKSEDLKRSKPERNNSSGNKSCAATAERVATSSSHTHQATGPRTPQGKERSKFNALKHGLFSKAVLLQDESRAEYDALLNGLMENLEPRGKLEIVLVENLGALLWRKRRLLQVETAEVEKTQQLMNWDPALQNEIDELEVSDRLLRYETHLSREFDRTLAQLERLQRMRLGQPVLPKLEVRHSLS